MDKQPIQIPPNILEKYGEPVDPEEFSHKVSGVMSVKAEDVPDVEESEKRSVGRPRKSTS